MSLTEDELSSVLSSLLFSCSVNILSNNSSEYQKKSFDLAKKLKHSKPDIKLADIQFLSEDNYEEDISLELLHEFKENLEVTSFEHI